MTLPLAYIAASLAASLIVFSSGYYIGQYSQHNKTTSSNVPKTVEIVVQVDENTVAKKDQTLCINEVNTSVKASSEFTTDALPVADESSKDNVNTPPPLSETELLQSLDSDAKRLAMEKEFRNSDVKLLESTIADMIEKGEPSEQIQALSEDLSQLNQGAALEVESNYDYSVEMTNEEQSEELIQNLNIDGKLTEESAQMARDMFKDVEINLSPTEVEDPPIPSNDDS